MSGAGAGTGAGADSGAGTGADADADASSTDGDGLSDQGTLDTFEADLPVLLAWYAEDVTRLVEKEVKDAERDIRARYPAAAFIELEPDSKDTHALQLPEEEKEKRQRRRDWTLRSAARTEEDEEARVEEELALKRALVEIAMAAARPRPDGMK